MPAHSSRERKPQRHALQSSENAYSFFGERKGSMNIAIGDLLQVVLSNIGEWFPNPDADIPDSHSDRCFRPMGLDILESRADLLGRIRCYRERGSLFTFIKKLALVAAPTKGKVEDDIETHSPIRQNSESRQQVSSESRRLGR